MELYELNCLCALIVTSPLNTKCKTYDNYRVIKLGVTIGYEHDTGNPLLLGIILDVMDQCGEILQLAYSESYGMRTPLPREYRTSEKVNVEQ